MQYMIKAVPHDHPYLTKLPFLAHNYRHWGHEVSDHTDDSNFIKEIKYQELKNKLADRRPSLMEIWVQDILTREDDYPVFSGEDLRLERVSTMLQDFFKGIAALGDAQPPGPVKWWSPKLLRRNHVPLPDNPSLDLATRYTRFLSAIRYTRNAPLPEESNQNFFVTDRTVLEFWPHGTPKWEQVVSALGVVAAKTGRWTEGPERSMVTGMIKVEMWVDVGDCIVMERSGEREQELVDPPPRYEREEGLPGYLEG